jgi:KTSC domain-containing protein
MAGKGRARVKALGWVSVTAAFLAAALLLGRAESVDVRYRGTVDLKDFSCAGVTRSSLVQRVCYDRRRSEMLISLNGIYYAYCGIPQSIIDDLMGAASMGRFFNASIKGRYGCR